MRLAIRALGYRKVIDFINDAGMKKSTLYAVLRQKTRDPGASLLKKFFDMGINLNWLVGGEGEILREKVREQAAEKGVKPYPQMEEGEIIEQKIKDAMNNIMGIYQQLKELRKYATELDELPPEKQAIFHKTLRALLESMREKKE